MRYASGSAGNNRSGNSLRPISSRLMDTKLTAFQYLPKPCLLSLRLTSHLFSQISIRTLFTALSHEINHEQKTYLHSAIATHNHDFVSQLLGAKASPCSSSVNNSTPLHTAARANCQFSIALLLQYGVDVDEEDKFLWTSLQLAARFGFEEVAIMLIEHGANVNKRGFQGWTALDYAVRGEHKKIEALLKGAGAKDSTKEATRSAWGQWSPFYL